MDKILIVRFSSIGDIVLTTPVIRALHNMTRRPEIHFITKKKFAATLQNNPYIDKLYTFDKEITEISSELKTENYTYIIDLHTNLRSKRLRHLLKVKSSSFNKLNIKKWMRVKLKYDRLPNIHIVNRYMKAVEFLGIENDDNGLDYFVSDQDLENTSSIVNKFPNGFHAFVIGGAHFTKQIPTTLLIEIANNSALPVVLVGGPEDQAKGEDIVKGTSKTVLNTCGNFSLNEAAAIIKQSKKVLSSDTGMMHIASAFKKEILSLWGNTIPEFGMYPYFPKTEQTKNHIYQVQGLPCRPCSKIGFDKCPKNHFNCMLQIDTDSIIKQLNS
ncbi:MAG: glycosyltransferase family 9 protein [Bacteroidales bacterium]|nr:glycosyltransferase family 9 protein [Bacteroidales bacterium]